MELYEREFFISRVFMGYVKHKLKDGLYIYIHPPSIDEKIKSDEVFMEAYEDAVNEGVMSSDECLSFMMENGIWNPIKEEKITDLEEQIENLKLGVFESFFNIQLREKTRSELKLAKNILSELNLQKHSYDHVTVGGVAT